MKSLLIYSINFVNIFFILVLVYISLLSFEVFAYTLEIQPYRVPSFMGQTGVDVITTNLFTGAYWVMEYPGFPPSSIFINFPDSAMPAGSDFSVCSYYHNTRQLIGCNYYVTTWSANELVTINLSP